MRATNREIILAYRHLYQHLLRAVQYAKPARYVARDRIRAAFRNSSPESYSHARISRTLEFLDGAARSKGLEHKILKNLMHVWWERARLGTLPVRGEDVAIRQQAHVQFDRAIKRLSETMGLVSI